MRNILAQALRKATVLVAIAVHWVLDDIVIFLPDMAVDAISKMIFKLTGNEYRFSDWQRFWNKKPDTK